MVVVALATLGLYAHVWLPKVLPVLRNHENADLLKSIVSVVQILFWIIGGVTFISRLWRPKKKNTDEKATSADKGGQSVSGELSVYGDLIGRDKIEGDTVAGDKVAGNKYVQLPALPVVKALHQLPTPPADFIGRDRELKHLVGAVKTGGITISGLQGLGGVGKTALALKIAAQLKTDYPDAQFYLDLKGVSQQPLTPRDAMAHVVRGYQPTAQLPESEDELRGIYLSVLHEKSALILMDNARDAQQVAPLIPPSDCLLLVTSRQHFTLPGLVAKNLDKLPSTDARRLLLCIAPRLSKEEIAQLDELARLCGYLPLALRAVASALQVKKNINPTEYAKGLADVGQRLKLTQTEAALQSSYDLLSDEMREKFRFLSVFSGTFDLAAAAAVWDVPLEVGRDLLGDLLAYSLVDFDEVTDRYGLHDLVRILGAKHLSNEESNVALKRHGHHYLQVLITADSLYKVGGTSVNQGLALYDAESINIHAAQSWVAANSRNDVEIAKWCWRYPHEGVFCLFLRQSSSARIHWLETALDAARSLEARCWEAIALGNLGLAYFNLGEFSRAKEYLEESVQIMSELSEPRTEGQILSNLGFVYHVLGQYQRSIDCLQRSLELSKLTGDRVTEGQSLGGLGRDYFALHQFDQALKFQEQRFTVVREIGDRYGESETLADLAHIALCSKNYQDAAGHAEQSLEISHSIGYRRGEFIALSLSARALDQLGDRAKAIFRGERALQLYDSLDFNYDSGVREELATWLARLSAMTI